MRIAITGATGFMGGVLARRLAASGHTVYAYGRRPADQVGSLLPNYAQWDLPDELNNRPEVDAVIHCAAKVGDWGPDTDYIRVNVTGTLKVLETFATARQFVHVSSGGVYSSGQSGRDLVENASVGVGIHTAYARSKVAAEKAVLGSGREAIILRPHKVYGPGDTTLLPRVLAARRFGWLAVPGNGQNTISVTHIDNFVHAVERVLETKRTSGIFNVADAETPRVDDLLRTLLLLNGAPTRLLLIPSPLAWGAAVASEFIWQLLRRRSAPRITRYLVAQISDGHTLDLARAVEQLGYQPKSTFRDQGSNVRHEP